MVKTTKNIQKTIWQADFYKRPLRNSKGEILWELLLCQMPGEIIYQSLSPQSEVNVEWLVSQLEIAIAQTGLPEAIQVFRPQSLNLLASAGQKLGIKVEATRRTSILKQKLQEQALQYPQKNNYTGENYHPIALDKPPPLPLPENIWGDGWRFAAIEAGDMEAAFCDRAIPIFQMPEEFLPVNLGLASTVVIPGITIYGGKKSMALARWLAEVEPFAINYIPGMPDGLILEAGLVDRWVVATFEDPEVAAAGRIYQERQESRGGLHFLLIQPDDSGMTYTGFWLLKSGD
ncbi:MAG TPA: hypothetical protein DEA78_13195 [Cyanobacteria bacterium UBA11159]|nr:hypothetical protein [Cyanobacteria bacterium UBA11159]HBS70257.1 hypothetical protein [Cyanobacteria bacterium UBA11153]HCA94695.1 hypothetical protein [Cyanobacteria bacterium UBA9226]